MHLHFVVTMKGGTTHKAVVLSCHGGKINAVGGEYAIAQLLDPEEIESVSVVPDEKKADVPARKAAPK